VAETDIDRFVEVVAALEPTFGGINLEDIKAPECFIIEKKLRERMKIPVFHDDQHGTAIVCAAAIRNGLVLQGKTLSDVKLVTSGAGAAALACVDLLVAMGLPVDNITLTDIKGVVHKDRGDEMPPNMARYARKTDARTLGDVLVGRRCVPGPVRTQCLKPEWLPQMAAKPLILALANPDPEILPGSGQGERAPTPSSPPAARLCQPGQQCPVLSLRLPGRAGRGRHHHQRTDEGGGGGSHRRARPRRGQRCGGQCLWRQPDRLRPDYIIPKPFDPRLILHIAPPWRAPPWSRAWRAGRSTISSLRERAGESSSIAPAS
jgi:malate dehydrogenase (oxaloacetate-decarboxylating)(NADP+)